MVHYVVSETENLKYDQLLERARGTAKYWIPKLCKALRRENSEMSNDDIRERVSHDCLPVWQKSTIRDALPDEYKHTEKAQAGKKGRQKQLDQASGTVVITEEAEVPVRMRAENGPNSPAGKELQTSNKPCPEEIVSQPQCQSNITNQEHQGPSEGKAAIHQEQENTEEASRQNSEGVGLIKASISRGLNKINRRGWAALVRSKGIEIRRTIESDKKGSVKLFLLHEKDQVLVPVIFTVDFSKMTTSLILDEK
jgi:hypothetical protein